MDELDDDLKEIERIAENLLIGSKSYDIFPTPVESVLSYAELTIDQSIDLSQPVVGFESIYKKHLRPGLQKILGILDRSSKTVFLDQSMNTNRKRFVQLHEVGHQVIPWQAEILNFVDDKYTIDPATQEQFEQEASYLASCILFQKDRFSTEIRKLDHSIQTPIDLSEKYGASIHATIRRYVLQCHTPCALLVLNPQDGIDPQLQVRNSFESPAFRRKFGKVVWPKRVSHDFQFVLDATLKRRRTKGTHKLICESYDIVKATYQHFFNYYNHFVLFTPANNL